MKLTLHLLSILNTLICINHFLLAFQSLPTTALLPSNETDKLALLALKDQILEDPLGVLTSWNKSLHFCNWTGVLCRKKGENRVTSLNLAGQKLVGSIPRHIGNLSFLRHFNLSDNNFKGEIPQEIGRLFQLRHLNLSYNIFQGKIPSNLSFCSNLEDINFSFNYLTGEIPVELQHLSKSLHEFQVGRNQLIGTIPQWLGNASSLIILSLASNNIHGRIPGELGRLSKLLFLQLSINNLQGSVPPSIFNLSSLEFLGVATNQLWGRIPSDIGFTLPNIQFLEVHENYFYGEIPSSLLNATELEALILFKNNFSGVVPSNLGILRNLQFVNLHQNQLETTKGEGLSFLTSLTNCSDLQILTINYNHFEGELPTSIANLSTKLQALIVGGDQDSNRSKISGKIPKEIGNLVGLTHLDISYTYIRGEISSSIGKLENLCRLYLEDNRISGSIPSSLGNITQLEDLSLSKNNISGLIPLSLGNCSQLQFLSLDNNFLVGSIPKQLFCLSHIIGLYLFRNSFTRLPLDLEVDKMTNQVDLDVSYNQLSGGIPSALGNCLMMENLILGNNLLEGSIPPSFITLKSLVHLDLSNNNLSGEIPKYFQKFPLLQLLNLSFNNFEGELPTEGIFINASIILVIGNQRLCGGIHQLGLPPCEIQGKKKRGKLRHWIVLISVATSCTMFLMMVLLVIFTYKRRSKRRASTSTMVQEPEQFPKISYAELTQATNGFSSSNLIGMGSFGSVYKGILSQDGKLVAVKVFNLVKRGAFKSFLAECEALRNIQHRNLIKIVTACSSIDFKGTSFEALVYEFMQNGSLEEWLHPNEDQVGARCLSLIQRLNITIEVAYAIEYLHDHCQPSIVHADLKPSNVLLDEDMVAHVGDFGLARFLSISQTQSSSIGVKGTIGYIAPEYGMTRKRSKPGDVYSFGILLLEMITGKRPTDSMFKDDFTIHQFIKTTLPESLVDILEPSLLQEVQDVENSRARNRGRRVSALESLVAVARIGVLCSMESPSERMEMKEVVAELCAIRDKFLGNRI